MHAVSEGKQHEVLDVHERHDSVIFVLIYFLVLVSFQFYQTCWRRRAHDLPKTVHR